MRLFRRIIFGLALYGIPAFLVIVDGIIGARVYRWEIFVWGIVIFVWMTAYYRQHARADTWRKRYNEVKYTVSPDPPKTIRLYPGEDDSQ